MSSVTFSVVDVFATTPFKGNPLAIVDNMTDNLTDTQLKLISRQFNLSETTFFLPPTVPEAHYRLRSFLPDGREVFGAGHNILGIWWWLAHNGYLDLSKPNSIGSPPKGSEEFEFHQQLGEDVMPIRVRRTTKTASAKTPDIEDLHDISILMRQASPKSHNVHPDPAALAESLGLTADDIGFSPHSASHASSVHLQPQVMSTSTTRHLFVPVSSVVALNRISVQRDRLLEQLSLVDNKAYGLFVFAEVQDATYQARFFSPGMSGEDPATGSAAGPLALYLHQHGRLTLNDGVGSITVHQGLRVGRECLINVTLSQAPGEGDEFNVDISGGGSIVASGTIVRPDPSLLF